MATIIPFRGIVYNKNKISDLSDVLTPPYDVISPADQDAYHTKHPNNIIRLILGRALPTDSETDNSHTRAAEFFGQWQEEGVLIKEETPAFYLNATEFSAEGKTYVRFGLLCRVKLETFDTGIVRPHEMTFSKVKSERLSLFKKCAANFSPIFSLFQDRDSAIFNRFEEIARNTPDVDVVDDLGHAQRMWRITDPAVNQAITKAFGRKTLYIADGHHRYETALNYRNWVVKNQGELAPEHPANFVMMYVSSMQDPGTVIFAAHRMLSRLPKDVVDNFDEKVGRYFDITKVNLPQGDQSAVRAAFYADLAADMDKKAIGVALHGQSMLRLLVAKPGIMDELFAEEIPPAMRNLDVTVLTRLLFNEIFGLSKDDLDDTSLLSYSTKADEVVDNAFSGKVAGAFLLNPTQIQHVRDVAEAGLTMPRKATYFYPKVITGLVMNSLKKE